MPADASPSFVWVEGLAPAGSRVTIGSEESHYLARVCRARPGDTVTATDGAGAVASLRLVDVGRSVTAEVTAVAHHPRVFVAWVCCGAPEGERADWLVEKLAELGVAVLMPIDGARARWRLGPSRLARWRRLARAALRQSRQAWTMEVREAVGVEGLPALLPEGSTRHLLDPEGGGWESGDPGTFAAVVGPSGGLDPSEKARLVGAGFRMIRLARQRLRTETAAMAWAARWASEVAVGGSGGATGAST